MTLFGLLCVWVLMFGTVQSERLVDDGMLSDVDVKNMLRRLIVLEESQTE